VLALVGVPMLSASGVIVRTGCPYIRVRSGCRRDQRLRLGIPV